MMHEPRLAVRTNMHLPPEVPLIPFLRRVHLQGTSLSIRAKNSPWRVFRLYFPNSFIVPNVCCFIAFLHTETFFFLYYDLIITTMRWAYSVFP
jgi:hypothetical protein